MGIFLSPIREFFGLLDPNISVIVKCQCHIFVVFNMRPLELIYHSMIPLKISSNDLSDVFGTGVWSGRNIHNSVITTRVPQLILKNVRLTLPVGLGMLFIQ